MSKTEIYINAYPRSGTAWLTRLLNDILPQDECIVRRGHFSLKNGKLGAGKFYELDDSGGRKNPKQLNPANITDERIVFLVRDPRDICVSGAWLWHQPIEQFLDRMIIGDIMRCGRWDEYCLENLNLKCRYSEYTSYKGLLSCASGEIDIILSHLECLCPPMYVIEDAVLRNSFALLKKRIGKSEQALRKAGLRKGIAGDWRNHFTEEMNNKIWSEFGWMMGRMGYDK